jgi:predicted DNA-binding protein (MmcQ/YjbR family)
MAPESPARAAERALLAFALGYPGAYEDNPWGERVAKVKGKVFVFLGRPEDGLSLSVKLPQSGTMALSLPFASPTGYGLGKSGWVTVALRPRQKAPIAMLKQWIDESYRAVAPRTLVKALDDGPEAAPPPKARKKRPPR